MQNNITIIVLAAGASSRFNGDKRIYTLPILQSKLCELKQKYNNIQIRYILKDSDKNALDILFDPTLVLNKEELLFNPTPEKGIGSTIAYAMQTINTPNVLICLADMPFIAISTFMRVIELCNPTNIVAPIYQQQIGHPVAFGECFYTKLAALTGDKGAKSILTTHHLRQQLFVCDDPNTIVDIDYQEDWIAAQQLELIRHT